MRLIYNIKWSLKQFKLYPVQTIINITGLSIGFTVFALIFLFIWYQNNVDTFNSKIDNIYRIENKFHGITPAPYKAFFETQIPEIESACRWGKAFGLLQYQPENVKEIKQGIYVKMLLADSSFDEIFDFNIISGNPAKDFTDPSSIIISKEIAQKLFGDKNPINETVNFDGVNPLNVVGIMENLPGNSSIDFDVIVPFEFFPVRFREPEFLDTWNRWMYETFVLLDEKANPSITEAKMDTLIAEKYINEYNADRQETYDDIDLVLRPYKDIYLSEIGDFHKHGKKRHNLIFAIIAIFVLIIACINYINISTAVASNRIKALGVRKINGASRRNLINSILFEGIFVAFISIIISVLLIEFSLPYFKDLTGLDIEIPYSLGLILFVLVVVPIVLGLIAGFYPSYYITKFDLTQVLKGNIIKGKSGTTFRKILTIVQFSISVFLIIGTLTVRKQLNYIYSYDPGYETNQILYVKANPIIRKHFDVFKSRLLENSNVLGITRSNSNIMSSGSVWTIDDGEDKRITVPDYRVDLDFFEFFDIDITWGREFNENDLLLEESPFIINEKMADWYGGVDTLNSIRIWDNEIIGVIEDIQIDNLHSEKREMTVIIEPSSAQIVYFKINANKYQESLDHVEHVWNEIAPEFPFLYRFLDDEFEKLYKFEMQFGKIFTVFGVLSIFIACLGLFALASFLTILRTKEIGIRKALGSSTKSIVILLSKELTLWVLIANAIAAPLAYIFMNKWLNSFAYKTNLSLWIFLVSIFISIVIALSTILYHTISTAKKNPVESLRYE